VLVSGLLNPHGAPGQIVRLVAAGDIIVCYDARIIDEYRRVLQYEKFQFDDAYAENLIDEIKASGIPVAAKPLGFALLDPEDEKFLEVAIAGRVACLVTGNIKHYKMPKNLNIKIISPAEMLLRMAGGL
jgi:putative PIN family toxin of toxin-antitoxin system